MISLSEARGLGIMDEPMASKDYDDVVPCFEAPNDPLADHMILVSPEAHRRAEANAFMKMFARRSAAIFS